MSSHTKRHVAQVLTCLTVLCAAAAIPTAQAEWDADLRGGVNADAEGPFVGAGALTPLGTSSSWYFNPNAEYTAGDNVDVLTVNADVHYDFPTSTRWSVWLGAGPALATYDPEFGEDDDNDVGMNLLAGVGATQGNVRPYFQTKVLMADDTQLVIAGGVRW